jgi:hypothetical protein
VGQDVWLYCANGSVGRGCGSGGLAIDVRHIYFEIEPNFLLAIRDQGDRANVRTA